MRTVANMLCMLAMYVHVYDEFKLKEHAVLNEARTR